MKKLTIITIFMIILAGINLTAQRSFLSYYDMRDIWQSSPGSFKFGLYGFDNPAMTSYLHDNDLMFSYTQGMDKNKDYNRWGLFSGSPFSGFGLTRTSRGDNYAMDYRYSFSFGDRNFSLGLGYGFTGGDKSIFGRSNIISAGLLLRPIPYFSIGAFSTFALDKNEYETVVDLGIRPIKNYPLTFFGDMSIFNDENLSQARWSAGVSFEFLDGVRLNTRYFSDKALNVGLDISFGKYGYGMSMLSNKEFDQMNSFNLIIRAGAKDRSILKDIIEEPESRFVKLDLSGQLKYRKFLWFDNSMTLLGVLNLIEEAEKDKTVKGLVINATTLSANKELLWEVREKLKEFKATGKQVIVFLENAGLDMYHFASVADKIVIDPLGSIMLPGYIMGRSFYKTMLAKAGIGFEELRYFKYKSAVENFARDNMSDADKEQRQKIIDDWYLTAKTDISEGRELQPNIFDDYVNKEVYYIAPDAITKKLADTTGRWIDVDKIVKSIQRKNIDVVGSKYLSKAKDPFDDQWSKNEESIAVVYALGACDMEEGIAARTLIKDMKKAIESDNIKAIVLRVDSPGGDAMASDYIAEVIRQNKGKKPIIVSQGAVAGSGGYWLSMNGDKIVASPLTITGSIGVISAWIYDKGLKDSLGISVDYVKTGKYADLGFAYSLPFIGIGLPVRNLNEDVKSKYESVIKGMYKEFVNKVADGRSKKYDDVEPIAQGRVWSGLDGKKIGLVDELGGIEKAIRMAKDAAGIKPDEEIKIIEFPKPGIFDFSLLFSRLLNFDLKNENKSLDILKYYIKKAGTPTAIMPLDFLDYSVTE